MFNSNSCEPNQRAAGHQRWLAMQTAYGEYKRASEALECLPPVSGDSSNDERLLRGILQDRQRAAFERYLDARMGFLEFRFDESDRRRWGGLSLVRRRGEGKFAIASWQALRNGRPVLPALAAVMLLCAAGLYFLRQQNRVHELEAARDELWAALNQSRDEARTPPGRSTTQNAEYATSEPLRRTSRTAARKPQQVPQRRAGAKVQPRPAVQVQSIGARTFYSFSLDPSRQFNRVGPIQVSLRYVDMQRNYVSLSVLSGPVRLEVQRLRLGQPLWIGDGQRQQPLELVADRIAGNRICGRVIETRDKADLRASRLKTGPLSNP